MGIKDEYMWISDFAKGEDWLSVKSNLIGEYRFTDLGSYELKSVKTGAVYKFVTSENIGVKYVIRIEVLENGIFTPISHSVTGKNELLHDVDGEGNKKEIEVIKENVLWAMTNSASLSAFASYLNKLSETSLAINKFKQYLGIQEQEVFSFLHFLELDFENLGSVLCKIVRRKPLSEFRVINTLNGVFYAVPIKPTFEDLIDCLISKKVLIDLIGYEGILDIYNEAEQ